MSENVELLYDEEKDEIKRQKQEKIQYLQNILFSYQQQKKDIIEKNKSYKQHYELLLKQDETRMAQNAKEYEALIEEKKNDNNNLNKKISELKQTSRVGRKRLETYSENVKYPQDINNLSNQLKTLMKKKADYFSKLNKDIKTLSICQKELETLQKFYEDKKKKKNYINPKIEEDLNRLKEDLTGNETEIYNKVQNDQSFILKKQIHQEKVNNIFKTPLLNKPKDATKLKLKKGNSLEPLTMKAIRYDVRSGYNSRRMNIVAKNKSPGNATYEQNNTSNNNRKDLLEEEELLNINYNNFTDFEYRELLTKKEHCYDVISRLEKSIKEAMKMYSRKIKEIKSALESNEKKLNERKEDNKLIQNDINDLNRILSLNEAEAELNNKNMNLNKNKKININNEKELDSQKEYLSPEFYNKGKKNEKENIDITGNESLNELKGINTEQKMNNLNMKFPDLSNIEEDKGDKMLAINNEYDRNKAIDDIKKKYNIKRANIELDNNDDIDIDENDLNFEQKGNDIKKEEKEEKEENKFFKENENILKSEEIGQYEPPIDNDIDINNNLNEENNNNNNIEENKEKEKDDITNNNLDENKNNINKDEIINNIENNEINKNNIND